VIRSPEGDALRARLRANIDRVRAGHPSPIVPYLCGTEARALAAAAALLDDGLLVTAIRPPTVPAGTSRLRVAISAAHDDAQLDHLVATLARVFPTEATAP
jgi:7-keto-8-aminopelargonate synthetase-like enzyme